MLFCVTDLVAQDRPVYVVDTDPAPARIEGGTFFLVGGLVATSVRNRHTAPVWITLRAWVFDQAGRLKGTNTYCVAEWLDRGTRRVISAPLDVGGLVSSDSVTVAVERVISDGREWTIADPAEDGVSLARQRGHGAGRRLRLEERRTEGVPATPCPCDCQSTAARCEAHCSDTGLSAFTCTPIAFDGCSASCSCK
jgi:hypothetical protein